MSQGSDVGDGHARLVPEVDQLACGEGKARLQVGGRKREVPPSVHHGLTAVSGFARGRSEARESVPVRPISEERIAAVLPLASKQVKAMIELQLVSGARPGEICAMRGCDLDTTGKYRLRSHKTAHHGHDRVLYLGPRAQEIVRPFLKHGLAAARDVMKSDDLRLMARKLTEMVAEMPKLDRTQRESVRADLRCKVRRLLAMYGYPPDLYATGAEASRVVGVQ